MTHRVKQGRPQAIDAQAVWRSQAFWGTMVWIHENLLEHGRLIPRDFYILAALTDREAKIAAGIEIDPMTSKRLVGQLQKQFADEYEGGEGVGPRSAEGDKQRLKEEGMIYFDETLSQNTARGWRVAAKGMAEMNGISDGLGNLIATQHTKLQEILPNEGKIMTEEDGFYDRGKSFFGSWRKVAASAAVLTLLTLASAAEAGPRGFADETLTQPTLLSVMD